jgi:flagellar basal-body rod modification protein FlgD
MQLFTTNDGSTGSSGTSPTATVAQSSTGTDTSEMFTQLLIAQIKNQNPLDPADPSQFVTQLSQLSQVEALQQLVSQNSGSSAVLDSMQTIALGAQVGSTVDFTLDRSKLGLPAGSYTLAVQTSDSETPAVDLFGTLQSVRLSASGAVVMNVDGLGEVAATQVSGFLGKTGVSQS